MIISKSGNPLKYYDVCKTDKHRGILAIVLLKSSDSTREFPACMDLSSSSTCMGDFTKN